jgi:ribosomal protein S27AE
MPVHPDHRTIQLAFVGAWVALVIFGSFYSRYFSAAAKERLRPCMSVLVGGVFLGFVYLLYGPTTFALAAIPVTVIAFLNCRTVKYCPKCATVNQAPFVIASPKACPRCGSALLASPLRGS